MSKRQERQRLIRHYKETTGETEIDMKKVAIFAKGLGWNMPTPPSEIDMLAKQFAEDAQAERKNDKKTGRREDGKTLPCLPRDPGERAT